MAYYSGAMAPPTDHQPGTSHACTARRAAAPRRLRLVCALVFLSALAVRVPYALSRPVPLSADAAYYLAVAENIHHGRGLVCDYVWNYLAGVPTSLPIPSNEYWMPGTSIITAAAFAVARSTAPRVAQMASVPLGALLCAVTAWTAGALTGRRSAALLAGAAAVASYYLVELNLYPDHFMLNAVLVNLSLLALWYAWRGPAALAILAGALAGLAYLTRTDGALLVIVAIVLAAGLYRRGERPRAFRLAGWFVVAFVVIAAPWWTRQTIVFGHPSGANPLRTAFLTDYNDLFRLDQSSLTLRDYLQTNQVVAIAMKAYAVYRSLRLLAKAILLFAPLALAALCFRSLRRDALPWLAYLPLALLVPCVLVPYPTLKGTGWHLLPALIPGLLALGSAAAIRLHDLARSRALVAAVWLLIPAAAVSPGLWWLFPPSDAKGAALPLYPPVAADAVRALGPDPSPALTDSAWGLYHAARIPCAQFPTDGVDAALRIADSIGAAYLITRADAPDDIPAMAQIVSHPRFQPLARYPAGDTRLLVYRILPPSTGPPPR
jgi:4-amino-4-deoxy-L-arabinose transferase-like glycosyltransferase